MAVSLGLSFTLPLHDIAGRIGVPERTLRRHYADVIRQAELKVGRPTYQPTSADRDFVRSAASNGTPHRDIAPLIGCSKGTLEKYFVRELKRGKAEANISVGARLYEMATGDPSLESTRIAAIFWAKCQMGWRTTARAISRSVVDSDPLAVVVIAPPRDAVESSRDKVAVADAD